MWHRRKTHLILLVAVSAVSSQLFANAPFVTLMPITDGNAATNEQARSNTAINSVSFKRQAITTVGDYQLVSYYHTDGKLMVGRRKKSGNSWTDWYLRKTEFTSFDINDSHNTSTVAVDGDGFLHMAWGLHGNVMQYTRSNASVLNDNPFTMFNDTVGNNNTTGVRANEIPLYNRPVTYPEFTNVPNSGDLIFAYRTDTSGNGEMQLSRWNNTTNAWTGIRTAYQAASNAPEQPWIDNDFSGDALPNVNAYHNGVVYDANQRMHVAWTWRTGGDSTGGFTDFQSNHNLMYAYSDNHGVDWRLTDGTLLQRNGVHDIDENNATPVLTIPQGSSLINQAGMTVDANNRPMVATWWAPNAAQGNHLRQYMLAWHNGTVWQSMAVTNRNSENGNARVPESQLGNYSMSRPIIVVDSSNRAIMVFRDHQRGNVVTVAYSVSPLRNDWQLLDLTTENLGTWEPSYDIGRWKNDGILSMYYQPIGSATGATASVLEWDPAAYFNSIANGGQGAFWNINSNGDWDGTSVWTPSMPDGVGAIANFGGGGAAISDNREIELEITRTVGQLKFNDSFFAYTLVAGGVGSLLLNNGVSQAGITVTNGSHSIDVPVALTASGTNINLVGTTSLLRISGAITGGGDLSVTGGGTLILTGTGGWNNTAISNSTLQIGSSGTTGSLSAGSVAIGAGGKLSFNRSDVITIANNLTGASGTVRMIGTGTTTLTGNNTVGTAEVLNGTLVLGSATALPAGVALGVHSGTLDLRGNSGTVGSLGGNAPGGVVTDQSAGAGTTTLTVNGSTTTDFFGGINNGASRILALNKSGTGTIKLRGASNFTGGTSLTNGYLDAYHNQALGLGTVTINGAGNSARLTLANGVTLGNAITLTTSTSGPASGTLQALDNATATFSGPITINAIAANGGHFSGPTTSGVLNFSGPITATNGITLISRQGNIAFGGGGSYTGFDLRYGKLTLTANNGLATNAVLDIAGNGSTGAATIFDLSNFNQTIAGLKNSVNNANLAQVTNTGAGLKTLTLDVGTGNTQTFGGSIGSNLNLVINSGTQILTKTGAGGTANGIYNYTGKTTVGGGTLQLERSHDSNHDGYNITGGSLVVNSSISPTSTPAPMAATGTGVISVNATGSARVSTLNAVGPIVNNGSITTTLGGNVGGVNGAGSLSISGGTLTSAAGITQNLVDISSGATLDIAANGSASAVSKLKTLILATSGANYTSKLQLHDNDLVVDYTGSGSPYTTILNMVKKGLVLLGGNGQGIASSEVDTQLLPGTMLAVVDNGAVGGLVDSLSGFGPIPDQSILVKYTWRGDANLDGVVNGSDYALADTGFSGGGSGWFYGDMNYDGVINGSDYALIDTGFSSQTGPLPEPASLGLIALSVLGLRRRIRCG